MPSDRSPALFGYVMPLTVGVAQLVRASDCGSEGRGFESRYPPQTLKTCVCQRFAERFAHAAYATEDVAEAGKSAFIWAVSSAGRAGDS